MRVILLSVLLLGCFNSCRLSPEKDDLVGEWKYVVILNVSNPEESTGPDEIALQRPSIRFTNDNKLFINWGGKVISHGTYRLDGKLIRYREDLSDGKSREFPFLISDLTPDKLVFETMERDAIRVTASRVR